MTGPAHLFTSLSNHLPGMEDEFNRWNNEIHVPEFLATPYFVAAQRFRVRDSEGEPSLPWRYVHLYEVGEGQLDAVANSLLDAKAQREASSVESDEPVAGHKTCPIPNICAGHVSWLWSATSIVDGVDAAGATEDPAQPGRLTLAVMWSDDSAAGADPRTDDEIAAICERYGFNGAQRFIKASTPDLYPNSFTDLVFYDLPTGRFDNYLAVRASETGNGEPSSGLLPGGAYEAGWCSAITERQVST
jgi:hypothetical protein